MQTDMLWHKPNTKQVGQGKYSMLVMHGAFDLAYFFCSGSAYTWATACLQAQPGQLTWKSSLRHINLRVIFD